MRAKMSVSVLGHLRYRLRVASYLLHWGAHRYFFSHQIPYFERVLLIESGSRYLFEDLLPGLYATHPELERLDLLTCYSGVPKGFDAAKGDVYYVSNWVGSDRRKVLYQGLRDHHYTVAGMICSGEPIMTKWKWSLAWLVPTKYFLLNENGDWVWFDYANFATLRHFVLVRTGLAGAGAVSTIGRLLLFPFTFLFLLSYAAVVHLKRRVRT
jgi:hypothetical protein